MITADSSASDFGTRWSKYDESGFSVHALATPYSNRMSFNARIRSFFRFAYQSATYAARLPADIIFATSTPLTIAIPAKWASIRQRAPIVFEVRDLWPEVPIAMGAINNIAAKFAARQLEKFAYKSAEHIVALSPGMAAGVEAVVGNARPITVIPNSADIEDFSCGVRDKRWLEDRFGIPQCSRVVLYAGTLGRANEVEYLVRLADVMRSLDPNIKFLIVGDGARNDSIKNLAIQLGLLESQVFTSNHIAKTEMPNLLSSVELPTSLFLNIPELEHNSANKFFDALAAGKGIAINYGGWQSELIQERGAGIVLSPSNLTQAAKQLHDCINDDAWLSKAGEAALQLAADQFDRNDHAAKILSILESVGSP